MSKRHNLDVRRHSLEEIREILDAMKNFAYMETRKISKVLVFQHDAVENLETVANDFATSYGIEPPADTPTSVYILVGTERGFCGDINHALAGHIQSLLSSPQAENIYLIVIGQKLVNLLANDKRVLASISGATVLEDIDNVMAQLIKTLGEIQSRYSLVSLQGMYYKNEKEIAQKTFLPPFSSTAYAGEIHAFPPILTLEPRLFLLQLTEQYLFAAINEMLSTALMSENFRRVNHLDQAVHHLDDEQDELLRHSNSLRQEEITEELEVILLSADSLEKVSLDAKKKNIAE